MPLLKKPYVRVRSIFYRDRYERGLENPPRLSGGGSSIIVDSTHPAFADLIADARYYAFDVDRASKAIVNAAKHTVNNFENPDWKNNEETP